METSNNQLQPSEQAQANANNSRHHSSRQLRRADRLALLRDPPSTKSTLRNNDASAVLPSLSTDRDDTVNGTSARSRIDAILTKSKQTQSRKEINTTSSASPPETPRSLCKQRWEEKTKSSHENVPSLPERNCKSKDCEKDIRSTLPYQMHDRTASLIDNDEDDAKPAGELADVDDDDDILLNDNTEGKSIISNSASMPSYPSPPRTPNGSRVNAYGLVSILKGCAECGTDDDYLYDSGDDAADPGGSTPARRRRRLFFQRRFTEHPTPPSSPGDRTIASRVSFSEELVVRELPQMSLEEKSRRFYTADELQSIRKDAREEKEMTAQFNDDVNFFCGDLYHAFCVEDACASYGDACVSGDAFDCGVMGGDSISDYGRYGGL